MKRYTVDALRMKIKLNFPHNFPGASRNISWDVTARSGVQLHQEPLNMGLLMDSSRERQELFCLLLRNTKAIPDPSQTQSIAMKKMVPMGSLQERQQNILMLHLLQIPVGFQEKKKRPLYRYVL